MKKRYISYHLHTTYSVLDGMIDIEKYVNLCKENGLEACGIADHANVSGFVEFYKVCLENNIKPIFGVELNHNIDKTKQRNYCHIIAIAKNTIGIQNLYKLTNIATDKFYYKPRVDLEDIINHKEGLIITSACIGGIIPYYIKQKNIKKAEEIALLLKEEFKDDFYIEVQNHNIPEEKEVNENLIEIAKRNKIKLIFGSDAHYMFEEDKELHNYYLKIRTDNDELTFEGDNYHIFQDPVGIPEEAIQNTFELAEKVEKIEFNTNFKIPKIEKIDIYEICLNNLKKLNLDKNLEKVYKDRLDYEYEIISKMGFIDYFTILLDILTYAQKNKVSWGVGRGSAAGSLIVYLLGITSVDPIKHNLMFERFLNAEKVTLPDVDIDIQHDRRDEIIKYITEKYNAKQIITFNRFSGKSQINDLKRVGVKSEKLEEYANKIEGLIRHNSVHASGVVLIPQEHLLPTTKINNKEVVQFDMNALDVLGYIKIDILGLKTVTLLTRIWGEDYKKIPIDDEDVFKKIFHTGNLRGVFQMESAGMQNLVKQVKPKNIDELAICNALYRPGILKSGLVDKYINNEPLDFPEEVLQYLQDTRGILVYQEQVMTIAHKIGKLTLPETDILRKAISKKKIEDILQYKEKFIENASEVIGRQNAEKLFEYIVATGEYTFNKSHSIAYSYLSYYTAYTKLYKPTEFYKEYFYIEDSDFEYLQELIHDAFDNGITIVPPDLEICDYYAKIIDDRKIMLGILNIKGIDISNAKKIIEKRNENNGITWSDISILVKNKQYEQIIIENCLIGGEKYSETTMFGKNEVFKPIYNYEPSKNDQQKENTNDYIINDNIIPPETLKVLPFPYIIKAKLLKKEQNQNNKKYKVIFTIQYEQQKIKLYSTTDYNIPPETTKYFLCEPVKIENNYIITLKNVYNEDILEYFTTVVYFFENGESDEKTNKILEDINKTINPNGIYKIYFLVKNGDNYKILKPKNYLADKIITDIPYLLTMTNIL